MGSFYKLQKATYKLKTKNIMPLKLSYVMRKGDWVKLGVLLVVGIIAISSLYREYQKTTAEYEKTMASLEKLY